MITVEMTAEEKAMWDEIKALVPFQKIIIEKDKGGKADCYLIEKRQRITVSSGIIAAVKLKVV